MNDLLLLIAGWALLGIGVALICGRAFAAGDGPDQLSDHEFWSRVDDSGRFR